MNATAKLDLFVRLAVTGLADSVIAGAAVALLALFLTFLFRQRSAATRFGVVMSALVAAASLPLLRLVTNSGDAGSRVASLVQVADSWAPWIFAGWALIAFVGMLRIGIGILTLRRIRKNARPLGTAPIASEITAFLREVETRRKVAVLVSDAVSVPAAIGLFRPAVVLPVWALEEMSSEELRHVITHEASHLKRWDDWTNLFQQVVKALLFFHPAIWWLENRLSLEREMACDDAVLSGVRDPRDYARCLAHIAERSLLRRGLAMAQAAVSRVRQTSRRVARILQSDKTLGTRAGYASAALAAILSGIAVVGVWQVPVLLSFGAPTPFVATPAAPNSVPQETAKPMLRPMNAAWHPPVTPQKKRPGKTALRKIQNPAPIQRVVPEPRLVLASWQADGPVLAPRMVLVVIEEYDGVTFWQIASWHFVPVQQVRTVQKAT